MKRTTESVRHLGRHSTWAILGLSAWLFACGRRDESSAKSSFNPGTPPAELANGERRFNSSCSPCHGTLGMGTSQGPPLVHAIYKSSHHSDESFRRAVALGVPAHHWSFGAMPPIRVLAPDEVEPIIRYVRWLQGKAGIH